LRRSAKRCEKEGVKIVTHEELLLDCLKVGLDGEKVDYEFDKIENRSVVVKFEDGRRFRVAVEETS